MSEDVRRMVGGMCGGCESQLTAMCGRFTQRCTWREIHDLYGLTGAARNLQAHYNIALTDAVEVVKFANGGITALVPMRWGLIPYWWKKPNACHRQRRYCVRPRSLFQISRSPVMRNWILACQVSPFTKHFARTRQAPSDSRRTESNSHRPPAVSARALVIRRGGPSPPAAHDPASERQFPTNSGVGSARGVTDDDSRISSVGRSQAASFFKL
jgi:hypothetical protein